MRVLFFGSRSLTWKHLPVSRALALHAVLEHDGLAPLDGDLLARMMDGRLGPWPSLPDSEPLVLLNGDGPPGKERGAIGEDKLSLLACMEAWPERRRVRWFAVEPLEGESWGQAAARRDVEMAEARPHRAYCVHTDLDSSKGSKITADALKARDIRFWYVRVTPAGAVVSVEER